MIIQIKRFGEFLSSRTEGREAALLLLANELRALPPKVELDFSGILVMTPSWLGEFVNTFTAAGIKEVIYTHLDNASVKASVEMTQAMPGGL